MAGAGQQTLMLIVGVFVLSFVAIYVLKFIEQMRGASAPNIEALTGPRNLRNSK